MAEVPRSVLLAAQRTQHAELQAAIGQEILGLTLQSILTVEDIPHVRRMSLAPYDPYLNWPSWLDKRRSVVKRWTLDKGPTL